METEFPARCSSRAAAVTLMPGCSTTNRSNSPWAPASGSTCSRERTRRRTVRCSPDSAEARSPARRSRPGDDGESAAVMPQGYPHRPFAAGWHRGRSARVFGTGCGARSLVIDPCHVLLPFGEGGAWPRRKITPGLRVPALPLQQREIPVARQG